MLHFPFNNKSYNKEILMLLDQDLCLIPEELAVYIYRIQREIVSNYGEERYKDLLLILSYIMRMYTQIEIYYSAKIGENFKLVHGLGTVIGARVEIGDNVEIYQNVTIGDKKDGGRKRPVIGNGVSIYAGSKVLGGIHIGDNCIIGANSVVLNSFQDNLVIAGAPAKEIRRIN